MFSKPFLSLDDVTRKILDDRAAVPNDRSLVAGISGIDGCGKGYVTKQLAAHLALHGITPAILNVDGWLNLPETRFKQSSPAENFYENAIRFDEFFTQLVMPLREQRSIYVVADFVEETASQYRKHTYDLREVDVILVEGIFLFKRQYRKHFDVTIWIDCSFATALARAIDRAQEGLSPANTIAAYEKIYFPAQRIHLAQDQPREHADVVMNNDTYTRPRITHSPRVLSLRRASAFGK